MFNGKNLVLLDKGKIVIEYVREYFTHADGDETETFDKTSNGKAVEVGGKKWEGTRPKGESKAKVSDLVQAALNRLVERYPLTQDEAFKKLTEDEQKTKIADYPWRLFLSAADYGADLWMRGEIQTKNQPTKPIDIAEGKLKMVKLLMAMGKSKEEAEKLAELAAA